jgi:HEPN domain-containing protein
MAEAWSAVPEWIRKAEADWAAASTLHSQNNEELHDAVVFHAQQCVEKLLKARLIQLNQPIQKVHDLVEDQRRSRQLNCSRHLSWFYEALDGSDTEVASAELAEEIERIEPLVAPQP